MAAKTAPTYYVLHGKNTFDRAPDLMKFRAAMGTGTEAELNIQEFRAESATVRDILNDAMTMPFLHDKRLVIVHDLLIALTKKGAGKDAKADLEKLVAALPTLPEYARLVFVESDELPASHPVLKLLETDSHGYEKLFQLPKNLAEWVARRAAAYDSQIEPRAANLLAELIGPDLFMLDNEMAKLAAYVGGERPITDSDVTLLCSNNVESKIYEIADLLGNRRAKQAATMAHKLLDEGAEVLPIMGMVYSQFRKLMIVKLFESGEYHGTLGDALELNPKSASFIIQKLREQAAKYSLEELESIHRMLLETDYKLKSGGFGGSFSDGGTLALDLLIASVGR